MSPEPKNMMGAMQDAWLTLDELCRVARVNRLWVIERVETGLLADLQGEPAQWRFDALALTRVRTMSSLERDFEAVPELAAIVADLQAEIETLRRQLRRAGFGG